MKAKIITTVTIVTLASLVLATPALSQRGFGHGGPGPGPGPGPGHDFLIQALDLSPEQETAIETIREQYHPEIEAARRAVQEKREDLFHQVHAQDLDDEAIRELGAQLGAAEAESALVLSRMRQEIHGVLTEEQLARLEELRPDPCQRRGHRGARGMGRFGSRSER